MELSQKVNFKQLPPLTPPYTGGETAWYSTLPLCKGELEGVVGKYKQDFLDSPVKSQFSTSLPFGVLPLRQGKKENDHE